MMCFDFLFCRTVNSRGNIGSGFGIDNKEDQKKTSESSSTSTNGNGNGNNVGGGGGGNNININSGQPEATTVFLHFIKKLTNITRDAGGDVMMRCEVEGEPKPKSFIWLKNNIEIKSRPRRIRIRKCKK